MTACENCWVEAQRRSYANGTFVTEEYYKLIQERKNNPCTPEQQRGDDYEAEAKEVK